MSKATITYRFDREEHGQQPKRQQPAIELVPYVSQGDKQEKEDEVSYEKQNTPNEAISRELLLNDYTTDYGQWQSSFDEETQRIEKLIKQTSPQHERMGKQTPVRIEQLDVPESENHAQSESAEHGAIEIEDGLEFIDRPGIRTHYRSAAVNRSWAKVAVAVLGAIATGCLFGFLVLSLFSQEQDQLSLNQDKLPITADTLASGDEQTLAEGNDLPIVPLQQAKDALLSVEVPAQSYYLLQNGLFSTKEGAEAAKSALRQAGFAAVVSNDASGYKVYAGMSADKGHAELISTQLLDKNFELLIKPLVLPAISQMSWTSTGSAEELQQYITQTNELLQIVSGAVLTQLEQINPGGIDHQLSVQIAAGIKKHLASAAGLEKSVPAAAKPYFNAINTAVKQTEAGLADYSQNLSSTSLWSIQNELMNGLLNEQALLKLIMK